MEGKRNIIFSDKSWGIWKPTKVPVCFLIIAIHNVSLVYQTNTVNIQK